MQILQTHYETLVALIITNRSRDRVTHCVKLAVASVWPALIRMIV